MENLKHKYETVHAAAASFQEAIENYAQFATTYKKYFPDDEQEKMYKVFRDSLIRRFEYTIDLFWKYLKVYLETQLAQTGIINSSTAVQAACLAGLMSEHEGRQLLLMIKGRNKTSHIYVEEVAEQLAAQIPAYHELVATLLKKMKA